MPKKRRRPDTGSRFDRYPQITFRFADGQETLVREHMKARELRSKAAVVKQALDLYLALDLPNATIERLVSLSKSYRRPVGDLFEEQIDDILG